LIPLMVKRRVNIIIKRVIAIDNQKNTAKSQVKANSKAGINLILEIMNLAGILQIKINIMTEETEETIGEEKKEEEEEEEEEEENTEEIIEMTEEEVEEIIEIVIETSMIIIRKIKLLAK